MRRILSAGVAALIAAATLGSASAQTITYTVDCSKGQTISSAIERGDARQPLVVNVRGTCNEYVHITRNDVTLIGVSPGGAVHGPANAQPAIHIQADRVTLQDLDVSGGGTAVVVVGGPFLASMTKVVVHHPDSGAAVVVRQGELGLNDCTLMNAENGLQLGRGATARLTGVTEIRDNAGSGIYLSDNATVVLSAGPGGTPGTKILNNSQHGIQLENGSHATVNGAEIAGNLTGVRASASTVNVAGGVIKNNQEDGVFGDLGSTLLLQGNEIASNGTGVACRADCTMQIGGAEIHGNATHAVVVMLDSRAIFQAPETTATDNGSVDLWCGDEKSSVDGVPGRSYDGGVFFVGSVSDTCVGFAD